jgi:hypothetical protein
VKFGENYRRDIERYREKGGSGGKTEKEGGSEGSIKYLCSESTT